MNASDWVLIGIGAYLLFIAIFVPLWHQDREAQHRREDQEREFEKERREMEEDPAWKAMGGTPLLYTDKEER